MGRYRPPAPQSSKYITPEGARALREELDHLWRRKRPQVTRAVAEAAAQGDRSENAEYIYAKRQLGEIDRRIRYLRKRLNGIRIVDRPPTDRSRIRFGAWFTLTDARGATHSFRLVGPDEFDSSGSYISMDSPLGRAVMGKSVQEQVVVSTPEGEARYTVAAVRYDGA